VAHSADGAEIQAAITGELKKVQNEEFSAAFQKLYDRAKPCVYKMGLILNEKACVFLFFKKPVLKPLDHTVYIYIFIYLFIYIHSVVL